MWSLPDLSAMNERAVTEHRRTRGRGPSLKGKKCDYCDKPAKVKEPYFDIFGEKEVPKGYNLMCTEHAEKYGCAPEGYFWCEGCNRVHVENYTWEMYSRDTDDGRICLRCAFEQALDSDDPKENVWVTQSDVTRLERLLSEGKVDEVFDFIRHKAKHLIAVGATYWEDRLIFQANVELDSGSGTRITGFTSSESTRDGAVREIVDHLKKVLVNTQMRDFMVALGDKEKMPEARVALILDAAYQFAVSIGIYFERKYTRAGGAL